ncbi:MAG: class I SAM-dependent methyltransferase [Firmicutes bacterium]|nr:class I SAM-dependent methyltransferase [Bacillota bacterium]
MVLYEKFASYYDDIFPLKKETLSFLADHFEKGKTLDLGCATGEYSLGLSRMGYETLGIDIDPNMISIALEKVKRLSLLSRFLKGNFKDVVYKNQFENVFCIGNTLVHLDSIEEMKNSLKHVYESLKANGTLIIGIVNYDRILDQEIKSLPTITNNGVTFERKYEFEGDKINFVTVLKTKDFAEDERTILTPIRYEELLNLLKQVGFKKIQAKDGYSDKPFSVKKSFHLVIVANK